MRTCVYVDAYNLYYGSLIGTPDKWLDLGSLCSKLLPGDEIVRIRYCTARVKTHPGKVGTDLRQQVYLRALRTIPNLSIHYGRYTQQQTRMRLVNPPPGASPFAKVIKTEEKGSDVNLASYMLVDGMRDMCQQTVLISNDSDLVLPVRMLKEDHGKRVIVITPTTNPGRRQSVDLANAATGIRTLRRGPIRGSQFPNTLTDANGTIHKPVEW